MGIHSFALRSFAHNCSYKRANLSDLLSSLFKKKQPRANRSHRFLQWATMSKSLSSHFAKEQPWANCSRFCNWRQLLSKNERFARKNLFVVCFWQFFSVLPAPVTLYKRAAVNDSLLSLMTKERQEWFPLFHDRITPLLFRSQKMSDSLEKPKSEFPTLICSDV